MSERVPMAWRGPRPPINREVEPLQIVTMIHLNTHVQNLVSVPGDSKAGNLWSHAQWSTALLGRL